MEGIPPEDVKEHEKQKQGKQGQCNCIKAIKFNLVFFMQCNVWNIHYREGPVSQQR